jgi:hypothetical protein
MEQFLQEGLNDAVLETPAGAPLFLDGGLGLDFMDLPAQRQAIQVS